MHRFGYATTARAVPHRERYPEEPELSQLAIAAAEGDELAWRRLWERVEPPLLALVRKPSFLGRMSLSEDDSLNIVLAVMERLHARGFRRLKMFAVAAEVDPPRRLWPWLVVVTKRVAIDTMRSHQHFIGRRGGPSSSSPAWAEHTTASDGKLGGDRPPITDRGTARQLFDLAAARLSGLQRAALDLWLRGWDHDAIAESLSLDGRAAAERLVRAGLERLRRAVRENGGTDRG